MAVQILKDGEAYDEFDTIDDTAMLRRARLRVAILTRDNDEVYTASLVVEEETTEEETTSEE